jgi:hypothetical protein
VALLVVERAADGPVGMQNPAGKVEGRQGRQFLWVWDWRPWWSKTGQQGCQGCQLLRLRDWQPSFKFINLVDFDAPMQVLFTSEQLTHQL